MLKASSLGVGSWWCPGASKQPSQSPCLISRRPPPSQFRPIQHMLSVSVRCPFLSYMCNKFAAAPLPPPAVCGPVPALPLLLHAQQVPGARRQAAGTHPRRRGSCGQPPGAAADGGDARGWVKWRGGRDSWAKPRNGVNRQTRLQTEEMRAGGWVSGN